MLSCSKGATLPLAPGLSYRFYLIRHGSPAVSGSGIAVVGRTPSMCVLKFYKPDLHPANPVYGVSALFLSALLGGFLDFFPLFVYGIVRPHHPQGRTIIFHIKSSIESCSYLLSSSNTFSMSKTLPYSPYLRDLNFFIGLSILDCRYLSFSQ